MFVTGGYLFREGFLKEMTLELNLKEWADFSEKGNQFGLMGQWQIRNCYGEYKMKTVRYLYKNKIQEWQEMKP